ncbi:NlpC/P60 family protein [Georgenia sp. TF02-10]|nr:NlpC/P60 family protein [Georgenia sp. TF02-10]
MAATSATAGPSENAALPNVDVSAPTAEALSALATTPTVSVPTGAEWTADSVADEVEAKAPRPVVRPEPVVERSTQQASRTGQRAALTAEATEATTAEVTGAEATDTVAEATTVSAGAETAAPADEPAPAAAPAASASASAIVNIARQYIGTPYVTGGASPGGFDCSGFTQYVFAQAGISLPRTSSAQRGAGVVVSAAEARPGDLVWGPGHVGIYTGNGQHIAARNPSTPLYESPIYMSNPTFIRVTG